MRWRRGRRGDGKERGARAWEGEEEKNKDDDDGGEYDGGDDVDMEEEEKKFKLLVRMLF